MRIGPSQSLESGVSQAILRTLLYADVFSFPLTFEEVHRYLVGVRAPVNEVRAALLEDPWLRERIIIHGPLVALRGREHAFVQRQMGEQASLALWRQVRRYGTLLTLVPFVRMLAVTGALAANNARSDRDDIDLLIVTAPNRLWLSRLFVVLLVHLGRMVRVLLCPNYMVASDSLAQADQSLFTAHELAQMQPFYGQDVYLSLLGANGWAEEYLPNAFGPRTPRFQADLVAPLRWLKSAAEGLLSGRRGDALEAWERKRKVARLRACAEDAGTDDALFTATRCKGHMENYGRRITAAYTERLASVGLGREGLAAPGIRDRALHEGDML